MASLQFWASQQYLMQNFSTGKNTSTWSEEQTRMIG